MSEDRASVRRSRRPSRPPQSRFVVARAGGQAQPAGASATSVSIFVAIVPTIGVHSQLIAQFKKDSVAVLLALLPEIRTMRKKESGLGRDTQ